jgi:hypothetical protein
VHLPGASIKATTFGGGRLLPSGVGYGADCNENSLDSQVDIFHAMIVPPMMMVPRPSIVTLSFNGLSLKGRQNSWIFYFTGGVR